jgi:hypothetical protein
VLAEDREIDSRAVPRRAQGIGVPAPDPQRHVAGARLASGDVRGKLTGAGYRVR